MSRNALQIMVQAYGAMGMNDLRDDAKRVLDLNVAKDGHPPGSISLTMHEKAWWRFWE
jgi:outer membrane protein assembly factor BamD